MVRSSTTYTCEVCHKTHWTYDDARQCENGHIVEEAIEKVRRDIAEAFSGSRKAKAKRRAA